MRRPLLALLWAGAALACGAEPEPAPLTPWQQSAGAERAESASPAAPSQTAGGGGGAVAPSPAEPARGGPYGEYAGRDPLRTLSGRASYYHDSLAGNTTASGDVYDPSAHTAASRDLPFGTIVRVVRVDTGDSTLVRVNDRGPFGDHRRILDLSRAAAEDLDMIRAGVIPIRAEILHQP